MQENELIAGLKSRDERAFRELVAQFQDKVYNTALGMLQHNADAEDIAQEVFIHVYQSISGFKENASLSTWIYRITVNKCLDHLQQRKAKKRFGFVLSLWNDDNRPVAEPADFVHPGVQYDRKEEAAQLFRHIRKLPENQKAAFILHKIEGLGYGEIAAVMQLSESAVDSLLSRARQNLRKMILRQG